MARSELRAYSSLGLQDSFCNHITTSAISSRSGEGQWGVSQLSLSLFSAQIGSFGLCLFVELCCVAPSGCREGWEVVSSAGHSAIPSKTGFLFLRKKGKAEGGFDHRYSDVPNSVLSTSRVVIYWNHVTILPCGCSLFHYRKWELE